MSVVSAVAEDAEPRSHLIENRAVARPRNGSPARSR